MGHVQSGAEGCGHGEAAAVARAVKSSPERSLFKEGECRDPRETQRDARRELRPRTRGVRLGAPQEPTPPQDAEKDLAVPWEEPPSKSRSKGPNSQLRRGAGLREAAAANRCSGGGAGPAARGGGVASGRESRAAERSP